MRRKVRLLREQEITVDGLRAVIRYKNIKNLYLRVAAEGYGKFRPPQTRLD